MFKLKKLNSRGVGHLLAMMLVIVGVGIVGAYFVVSSHADSVPRPGSRIIMNIQGYKATSKVCTPTSCKIDYAKSSTVLIRNVSNDAHVCTLNGKKTAGIGGNSSTNKGWQNMKGKLDSKGKGTVICPEGTYQVRLAKATKLPGFFIGTQAIEPRGTGTVCYHGPKSTKGCPTAAPGAYYGESGANTGSTRTFFLGRSK